MSHVISKVCKIRKPVICCGEKRRDNKDAPSAPHQQFSGICFVPCNNLVVFMLHSVLVGWGMTQTLGDLKHLTNQFICIFSFLVGILLKKDVKDVEKKTAKWSFVNEIRSYTTQISLNFWPGPSQS